MFRNLYGETETMQFKYLRWRVILTFADLILLLIGLLINEQLASVFGGALVIIAWIWAWSFMRAWFGWTTFGAIFTGNLIFGIIIFLLYVILGYILGLFGFIIGTGRFIYLAVKYFTHGLEG